jgi:hypothetical protein
MVICSSREDPIQACVFKINKLSMFSLKKLIINLLESLAFRTCKIIFKVRRKWFLPRTVNKPRAWKLHCYFTHLVSRNSIRMRRNYCYRLWLIFFPWPRQRLLPPTWPDWSDDEREELDKIFGAMSEKGTERLYVITLLNSIFFIFAKPTMFRTLFIFFFSSKKPDYNVA